MTIHFNRDAVIYAKWQLLRGEFSHYASAVEGYNSDIFHKIKYPITPDLSTSNDIACAILAEQWMPLAVARPFVDEFITKDLRNTVSMQL